MQRALRVRFPLWCHLFVAAASVALIACGGAQTTGASSGNRAPDFTLPDIDGRTVRLSDYQGKDVVLVNFWATWCGPCVGEQPHLQRLYETYKDQGFVVLGVAMDGPESVAEVSPAARRQGLTFPVLLDEETRVTGQLNPKRAAPFNVLIGRGGDIVFTHEGYSAGDEDKLEAAIKTALAATDAAAAEPESGAPSEPEPAPEPEPEPESDAEGEPEGSADEGDDGEPEE